jgi:GT2 family glycosyltransferase
MSQYQAIWPNPAHMPKIAVLLTVHNRCHLTVACLSALFNQKLPGDFEIQVYVVDDGSSDGTTDEIHRRFPSVIVLQGDGKLYWCGGMRRAWSEASKGQVDYYLWLNDDTTLLPGAIVTLLDVASATRLMCGRDPIVVGSTRDPDTGALTYGGRWLQESALIEPSSAAQACDTINGNVVLIPRAVFEEVGNLSQEYTHAIGDHDYSLRAARKGVPVYVGPGYYGLCKPTDPALWTRPEIPLGQRWRALHGPKGIPPSEYSVFLRRHLPRRRLWRLLKLYVRVGFPSFWRKRSRRMFWRV